ncbi:MAG: hypothetical protein HC906_17515 [Bacteroidales bacterium]|nr:hypothetical protein [Bacteroidales bacterium]
MKSLIFIAVAILITTESIAQKKELVQVTGRIRDELLQPLPFAHIFILNNNRGTITDKSGKFSFVAEANDTIMFSSLGYRKQTTIIPSGLDDPF